MDLPAKMLAGLEESTTQDARQDMFAALHYHENGSGDADSNYQWAEQIEYNVATWEPAASASRTGAAAS